MICGERNYSPLHLYIDFHHQQQQQHYILLILSIVFIRWVLSFLFQERTTKNISIGCQLLRNQSLHFNKKKGKNVKENIQTYTWININGRKWNIQELKLEKTYIYIYNINGFNFGVQSKQKQKSWSHQLPRRYFIFHFFTHLCFLFIILIFCEMYVCLFFYYMILNNFALGWWVCVWYMRIDFNLLALGWIVLYFFYLFKN